MLRVNTLYILHSEIQNKYCIMDTDSGHTDSHIIRRMASCMHALNYQGLRTVSHGTGSVTVC